MVRGSGVASWLSAIHFGGKFFDFSADRNRIRPVQGGKCQFEGPLRGRPVDTNIHDGQATNFASLLQLENRSNLLGLFCR
jgi:hypothetical protein